MTVNNNKLLPCPFCGGKAKWKGYYTGSTAGLVECTGCAACTRGGNWEEAKEHWNTRWDYYGDVIECYECPIGGKEAAQRSVEENIRAQGYVKERTCTMKQEQTGYFTTLICSECGHGNFYKYEEPDTDDYDGMLIGMPYPEYCSHCGAKVVEEVNRGR